MATRVSRSLYFHREYGHYARCITHAEINSSKKADMKHLLNYNAL